MLYTQWSAEAWGAEVRLEFQAGTHVAGQIRCDDVELRHAIYSATNSVFAVRPLRPHLFRDAIRELGPTDADVRTLSRIAAVRMDLLNDGVAKIQRKRFS
jgi:hypothetical protein